MPCNFYENTIDYIGVTWSPKQFIINPFKNLNKGIKKHFGYPIVYVTRPKS